MRNIKRLGKAIATVGLYATLALAVVVSSELVAACQTGDLDLPGPVSAVSEASKAAHEGVTYQLDKLEWAFSDALAQLEHACTRGLVR